MILCALLLSCLPASAMPEPLPKPAHGLPVVVVVLIPGVSLSDLASCPAPAIRGLMTSGAMGLMNARTGSGHGRLRRGIDSLVLHPEEIRPTTLESGCLTLGAGTRCFARTEAGLAYDADEWVPGGRASDLWHQRTGRAPGMDRVYHTAIPRLIAGTRGLAYPAAPGALGQALHEAGMLAAVVGNADDEYGVHREAACIAMDAFGRVPLGSVGRSLSRPDPLSPGGYNTDARAVVRAAEEALRAGARLVVVETGDPARAERAGDDVQSDVRPLRRREAMLRADRIVAGLLDRVDATRALMLLVTPAPSLDAARTGNPLAPVVMAGRGVDRGLLFSPSTRTPGLCTNTDIAPTVLRFLRVPVPAQMVGQPLTSRRDINASTALLALEERFHRVEAYSRPMMRWLVWIQVALFGTFLFVAWVRPGRGPARSLPVQAVAHGLAALPSALLLTGALLPGSPTKGMLLLLLVDGALVAAAFSLRRWVSPIGLLFLAGTALLAVDLATGSALLRASPLGYSPYGGARYYGIGNEGFGWLVASLIFAVAFLWPRGRRANEHAGRSGGKDAGLREILVPLLGVSALSFGAAALVGHPGFGANFGGAVTAAAAGAVAAGFALQGKLSRRRVALLALGGLAVAGLPVLFELLGAGGSHSHIGRAVEDVRAGGLGTAWGIIDRKLSMNWLLLRRSSWSRLLLLAGLTVAYLVFRHRQEMRERAPEVWAAARTVLVGAAAALIVNDSGVLPAAEMVAATAAALAVGVASLPAPAKPEPPTSPEPEQP